MPRRIGICLGLAALSACSGVDLPGSNNGNNNGGGNTAACQITFGGVGSATGECTVAVTYSQSSNQTSFTVAIPAAVGAVTAVNTAMVLKGGTPTTGQWTEVTAVSTQMDVLAGAQDWLLSRNIAGLTTQGSATLTLTDLGTEHTTTDGNKSYTDTHGSFDASAPFRQGTNTTGTLTVHVVF